MGIAGNERPGPVSGPPIGPGSRQRTTWAGQPPPIGARPYPEVCSGGTEVLEVVAHLKAIHYEVRAEIKRRSQ